MLPGLRERAFTVAVGVSALSFAILVVLALWQPDRAASGWRFELTTYTTLTTMFSTLLSIGLISIIAEVFLRESYARAIRGFLQLRATLIRSGLDDIAPEKPLGLSARIEAASVITAVTRDPQAWVLDYYSAAVSAAKKRATQIILIFPDADSAHFGALAASLDISPHQLRQSIELATDSVKQRWSNAGEVHPGSTIAVRTTSMALYEVTCVDDFSACVLESSVEHRQGDRRMALTFAAGAGGYQEWLQRQITNSDAGEIWAGDAKTAAPRPRQHEVRSSTEQVSQVQGER